MIYLGHFFLAKYQSERYNVYRINKTRGYLEWSGLMKKIIYIFVLLFTFFIMNINAYAFDRSSVQVSCIYADAKVVVKSYDSFQKTPYLNINDYPTVNNYKLEQRISEYRLFFPAGYGVELQSNYINYYCPNTIYKYLVEEYDEDLEDRANSLVYSFFAHDSRLQNHGGSVYSYLQADPRSGWSQFWGTNSKMVPNVIDINGTTDGYAQTVPLVAERVELITNDEKAKTCSYIHKSSQASGSDSYIDVTYHPDVDTLYVSNTEAMTTIGNDGTLKNAVKDDTCKSTAKCLCVQESIKDTNSAEGTTEYTFNRPRHDVVVKNEDSCSCSAGYVSYSYHSSGSSGNKSTSTVTQVCSSIPETTKVLKQVIQWAQILVPAIVIILSGIDIGKMVVAGNLDEELPKRKKGMIIRFIVMLVFFFLPLIVKVLFSTVFDDGILGVGGIDCLFTD